MTEPPIVQPRALSFDPVIVGLVAMVVFLALTLRANHKKHQEEIAGFRDKLHSFEERDSARGKSAESEDRTRYSADTCSSACAEGHTYKPGCIQYVESPNAETL